MLTIHELTVSHEEFDALDLYRQRAIVRHECRVGDYLVFREREREDSFLAMRVLHVNEPWAVASLTSAVGLEEKRAVLDQLKAQS